MSWRVFGTLYLLGGVKLFGGVNPSQVSTRYSAVNSTLYYLIPEIFKINP